ncbi:MAG TPA: ATP-binding protein [Candidatus Dormibacteraeota bacterium]|nr:ATP-binding protein [Candidatus Dormibacteraeota bacterium]
MTTDDGRFDFRATFAGLDEGLDVIHLSIDRLREATGRDAANRPLLLLETALGEIGSNVLTHGRPAGTAAPVEYALRYHDGLVEASLIDHGVPVHEHIGREMPGHDSESGRGLAMARSLLDELGYERDGDLNRWRLVKRI